jgi:integrase
MEISRGDSVETDRKRKPWLGGFIRETKGGRPVYVIEKRIAGRLFKRSTRCHTEKAALDQLRKFEGDPGGYVERLMLTDALIFEYRDWQLDVAGNSHEWAHTSANMLADWMEVIGETDLRQLTAPKVKTMLASFTTSQPARMTVLKGFFTWLRKERGLLKHHEDPMPDVRIPERKSAKEQGRARDVPFETALAVYKQLRADVKDVLQLLSGTGWHLSEVGRFAEKGEIRKDPTGKSKAVLVVWHKRQEHAVTGLSNPAHIAAAKRLREQGWILSRGRLAELMRFANDAANIPEDERLHLGDMRHCVGTWSVELGEDMGTVARAFNHESEKMLRRHYVRHAVPRATIKTRALK